MENRMKKFALFALLLALSVTLSAQRSAPHGSGPRMGVGGGSHTGMGGGSRGSAPRPAMRGANFAAAYSNYSPIPYGFGMPFAYATNPFPENPNGGPMVIVSSPAGQEEPNIVYIPSYMRPNDGPSLAEIAAQLKTEHPPAKYIWRNVEPLLQPK